MTAPSDVRAPVKVLMVDDRAENLLALEAILSGLGHELIRANSGREALKALLVTDIALILLDVQMPGMDGFETAAQIKARERTQDIPIVFLTAIDGEAHQAFRGYAAGAVDYLSKPFDPWVLRAKVTVFIELYERRRELAQQAERLGDALHLAVKAVHDVQFVAEASGNPAFRAAAKESVRAVEAVLDVLTGNGHLG